MVWFQCEDCGDNLKKPKLPNHFNICSATKLSCIDCGEIFGQESAQSHTQCITETEKYGPKGQAKPLNGSSANKTNKDANQQPGFDINVGLSDRPPWFCSLCNTKATSRQTLLLHAEGKKHKGKARAIHAANQQQKQMDESVDKKSTEEQKVQDLSKVESEANNGNLAAQKKRKLEESDDDDSMRKKAKEGTLVALGNGEVIQGEKKIKWKKLITTVLKSSPEGVLKIKKLRKLVLKAIQESGITSDEDQLRNTLESKINSSSRFSVENKYVHLVGNN